MVIRSVHEDDYRTLKDMSVEILEPLYGSQEKALNEWFTRGGFKHAFVLLSEKEIAGFLSLKADPKKQYLKISTLVIFDGHKRMGCGRRLLAKSIEMAKEQGYSHLKVTVSESKQESLDFFIKYGFTVINRITGKYQLNVDEIILEMELTK